jgi:DNA-binding transcriptional LysR family regulator
MRQLNVTMDGQIAILAVAEKGSYEAAGKYLSVTRSTIYKRVSGMERALETPLFRPEGRRMVLTEAGVIYLPVARESVRNAYLGVDRVQALLRIQAKDLRVGYSSQLSEKLLAVIAQLRPEHIDRHASIQRESLLTREVISRVLQGELHVGFGFLPVREPDLVVRELMEEPLMLCLPAGHRLGDTHSIRPEDLDDVPLISVGRNALPGRHDEMVKHFGSLGISLNFVTDAYLPQEALWLVSRGVGLSLMTRSFISTGRSDIIFRPLSGQLPAIKSGVFVRSDYNNGLVKQFIEKALNETTALRPSPKRNHSETGKMSRTRRPRASRST